ncbi:MAG: hypothetical protein OXI34_13925 [Chloroflexota bacterium]|nr:hypothetical protein [Chloroflexota bacterium]MDE2852869.1 hypothetical protein [Chloroflexota bacterium]MDE2947941.1 hypothetical protein [Chloroflexota bacterium]
MKRIGSVERRSPFWSRLLGLLITFAIIAVLVFGGVKNLTSELADAHEALAASQYELGKTRNALDNARTQLVATENALAGAAAEVDRMGRKLEVSEHQLEAANNNILVLNHAKDQLRHRWANSMRALAQRNEQYVAVDQALRATQAELARLRNQPQWSVIVTSQRQMQMAERERFAMSQARMYAEGDGGMLYYEGMAAEHEIEKYFSYGERTQVILTTTAPGMDVLTCLNNPSLGCGAVVSAGVQAMEMHAYSYESSFVSEEMLLVDGRRGRRPGRRR